MAMFLSFTPRLMGQRPLVIQGVFIRWLSNQLKICKSTADHPLFIYFYLELMNSVKFHNGQMITVCVCVLGTGPEEDLNLWIYLRQLLFKMRLLLCCLLAAWIQSCGTKGHLTAACSFPFHFFRSGLLPQHQPRWPWLLAWSQNLCGAGSGTRARLPGWGCGGRGLGRPLGVGTLSCTGELEVGSPCPA